MLIDYIEKAIDGLMDGGVFDRENIVVRVPQYTFENWKIEFRKLTGFSGEFDIKKQYLFCGVKVYFDGYENAVVVYRIEDGGLYEKRIVKIKL